MKTSLWSAALLGCALTVGCADRGDNRARDGEEPAPAAETPAAQPDAPPAGSETAREARPTTGSQERSPRGAARSADERRLDATPPAERRTVPSDPSASSSAAPARRGVEWTEVTIPQGTALPLELETALSSETAQVETPVRARLKQAIVVNGVTALPAGATVSGNVTSVERAGRVKGRSSLAFAFTQLRADNLSAGIRTAPLAFVGEATRGEDATKIGAGAVGGAIVGGIIGGGEGAAKGAAIGGAAGTGVVLATRGKEVELASGTSLAATLSAPLSIRVPLR